MAHMRRALHLGRTAYFQFQIEIVDVVNIPYPQGRFLVKWNYKNGILSPKEAEQHAAAHNSKSAPDLSHPDPPHHNPKFTAREHLAPSNSSVAASSIASSMNSVDVPFDPTPEDDESPEAHHRPAKESTSKLLTHNDRIGFTPSVKVNRSHSAEYRYILKCSVAIPVRDNKLVASDVKFSVRHQYQVRGKWETSKLGECQINLAQHAHKEWMPSQEHRSGTGSRLRSDYASIAESVTYRNQIQRFLLQNGKTNALLRLKVDCQFIGGQPYRAPTQKSVSQSEFDKSESDISTPHSASSDAAARRESDGYSDLFPSKSDGKSTDGRTAQEIVDDIWAQTRQDMARQREAAAASAASLGPNQDAASSISSRVPSEDGVIMPEPSNKRERKTSAFGKRSPTSSSTGKKGRLAPNGPFNFSIPSSFLRRSGSATPASKASISSRPESTADST